MSSVDYHCTCLSFTPLPPPPHLDSSSSSFHPLRSLYFCEECDLVRCNRCVNVEVSGYYCPNCLFEVPSASVRAEKSRCARNCFSCPCCSNTLSVVSSDPSDAQQGSGQGEPPYFLYCSFCRWDSTEVDIVFEKPTGLATQLQRFEDTAPEFLEFERLKEHFDPVVKATTAHALGSNLSFRSSVAAAASAALSRDISGVGKYPGPTRSRRDRSVNKDEMPEYKTRIAIGGNLDATRDVDAITQVDHIEQVASIEQRWLQSWQSPVTTSSLKPSRIPLRSKLSKRCPTCTHILIKPEQKAQSVRYKIKLLASNYLPTITATVSRPTNIRRPNLKEEDNLTLQPGTTYSFRLSIANPLYDPITVRLSSQRMHVSATANDNEKARRPPFAVSLPTSAFAIGPYAEAWEFEDDENEDIFGIEDEDLGIGSTAARKMGKADDAKRVKQIGVLEKRANMVIVGGEIVIGKEARGPIKFNMLVTFSYKAEEVEETHRNVKDRATKTFSFYTVVDLGSVNLGDA